jgi:hypothetical protein
MVAENLRRDSEGDWYLAICYFERANDGNSISRIKTNDIAITAKEKFEIVFLCDLTAGCVIAAQIKTTDKKAQAIEIK